MFDIKKGFALFLNGELEGQYRDRDELAEGYQRLIESLKQAEGYEKATVEDIEKWNDIEVFKFEEEISSQEINPYCQ